MIACTALLILATITSAMSRPDSPLKPWAGVPSELSGVFRPHLDALAEEMLEEYEEGQR